MKDETCDKDDKDDIGDKDKIGDKDEKGLKGDKGDKGLKDDKDDKSPTSERVKDDKLRLDFARFPALQYRQETSEVLEISTF